MKDKKEKNIFKRIFRRIAAIFSAGAVTLTLAACDEDKAPTIEETESFTLVDTSDINLTSMLDKYTEDYDKGTIVDGTEMFKHYEELYGDLRKDQTLPTPEVGFWEIAPDPEVITYNFDMGQVKYDTVENGIYYIDGEVIKEVTDNSVKIKTLDGSIEVEDLDDSYCIINVNDSNSTTTTVQYNFDGSYTISENENSQNQRFEFSKDGMLASSEIAQKDEEGRETSEIKKAYKNGNINYYSAYDDKGRLIEERQEDGSYIIIEYDNTIDEEIYNFYSDSNRQNNYLPTYYERLHDKISYYYDENDKLTKIETHIKASENSYTIFSPNGDYYEYVKSTDENGKIIYEGKIENIYNKYRTREEKRRNKDGEFDVYVSKFDYSLLPSDPYISNGDTVFSSRNGTILVQEKDGIIYQYGQDGMFFQAYNVVEDGKNYYREDGSKLSFEGKNGKKIDYNKEGKICTITDDTMTTGYYDYEQNSISYISNKSDDEITVEVNGKTYKLSKSESVAFYESGGIQSHDNYNENAYILYYETGEEWQVRKDGIYTVYDKEHNITAIEKDKVTTGYYDYANNLIEYKNENGITTYFYRNNQIELIRNGNYRDGIIISVNDIFGNIYEIGEGDEIRFNENGTVKSFKEAEVSEYKEFGENYPNFRDISSATTTYYGYDENNNMYITSKKEENWTYKKEVDHISGNQSYKHTYYRDYENNIINSIDEKDRYTYYYKDTDQSCYYVKNKNDESFTVYRNGEVLYESNGTEKIYSWSTGGFTIVLEDGSQISSKVWESEDEIENAQEVEDDGR